MIINATLSIDAAKLIKNEAFGAYLRYKKYAEEYSFPKTESEIAMLEGFERRRDIAWNLYDQLGTCFSSNNIRKIEL